MGKAARGRGGGEQEHAGDEDAFAADEVAESPSEQEEAAKGNEIAVDDPGEVGLREVQVGLDGG